MKNNDLQFLQSELSRVSEWVQFADKKAGFIAVFYSAIFGFLWSQKNEVLSCALSWSDCQWLYTIVLVAIFVLLIMGTYFLFATVSPRLKNWNTDRSLFFFGNIAKTKIEDYLKDIEALTEDEARRQIAEQIHTNSVIADVKMTNAKKSTQVLVVIGILLLILLLL